MKKSFIKFLTVFIAVCLLAAAVPLAVSADFTDVDPDEWYAGAVNWCRSKHLLEGMGSNVFAPKANLTRAQLTVVLCKRGYANLSETSGIGFFTDVPDDAWYHDAVQWVADKDVVNGVGNCLFDPEGIVTREQLATFLFSMTDTIQYKEPGTDQNKSLDTDQRTDISGYADADDIADWAREAMEWAVAIGVMKGTNADSLAPKAYATRAELAMILLRYTEAYAKEFEILDAGSSAPADNQ